MYYTNVQKMEIPGFSPDSSLSCPLDRCDEVKQPVAQAPACMPIGSSKLLPANTLRRDLPRANMWPEAEAGSQGTRRAGSSRAQWQEERKESKEEEGRRGGNRAMSSSSAQGAEAGARPDGDGLVACRQPGDCCENKTWYESFFAPNHLLSLFHLTEFIVNLPGVGKHLLLELQPASV